jgi:plastocyanin
MLKLSSIPLAALWLAAFPVIAAAEIHDVSVIDNRFSPNDITIKVGDTVRWTNAAGGNPHDVTSDDGKFSPSVTASSFTFEKTFNSVDEILYHCTVHSSPGRNRNTSMNGRVIVEAAEAAFLINPAISDAWLFPPTAGQGFFIIVWEDLKQIFLAWFTYDTERPPEDVMAILGEPGHRWLTAQGDYEGDTALLDVFLASGMIFDSAVPPVESGPLEGATIKIVWIGCNEGLVEYDIPTLGLSNDIPIERIVLDNVPACEAAQAQ